MDDLIPFLIFIVIAVVNLVKFLAEKGRRKKTSPSLSEMDEAPSKHHPSSIESFFENLAEKLEPQPTELADWPEGREQPDYMKEMEEFEGDGSKAHEEEGPAEIVSIPTPDPAPAQPPWETSAGIPAIQPTAQAESLKMAMKSMPSSLASLKGLRMASTPMLRSSSAGRVDFPLNNKAELRKAIIANLIFSPPRACDATFANTIAK